jgi:hypothetical protein
VHLWETGLLLLLYVAYVLVTFYVCRGDEPVHADHHHHELPLEDLQGGLLWPALLQGALNWSRMQRM